MGLGHLRVWSETPGARVTAVCDGDAARAHDAARSIGAQPFDDLEDMARSGLIDAVDICTPSGLHADQGILAASHGLHVLCEKPLDLCIEKVDRLIEACESRGLTLAGVFQRRTYPAVQQVARDIAAGRMGRVLSASAYLKWWRPQSYYDSAGWRGTWAMDGGVLANQAIHAIDHLVWLAGPVAEVEYARLETAAHKMEAEDFALAVVRFESGARGVIEATTCCSPDLCSRIEVFGTRGAVAFEDATPVKYGLDGQDRLPALPREDGRIGGGSDPMAISLKGHAVIAADFVEAVRERREPLVPGRVARVSVDALNKIYRAALPGVRLGT